MPFEAKGVLYAVSPVQPANSPPTYCGDAEYTSVTHINFATSLE